MRFMYRADDLVCNNGHTSVTLDVIAAITLNDHTEFSEFWEISP